MTNKLTGSCLCEAVRYSANVEPDIVVHCYCVDCRKTSGTGHCTHVMFGEDAVSIEGEMRFYDRPADSGNIVSRGFCPDCGSPVLSRNSAFPGMVFVRASSLDNPDAVTPQMTVYSSRAPSWALIDQSSPVFEQMPPPPNMDDLPLKAG